MTSNDAIAILTTGAKGSPTSMTGWRLWRDPDAFDPRASCPMPHPSPRFTYLPFGAGPRVCVSAQFALSEAPLVLAALTRAFHIARTNATPVLPVAIVTTQPDRAPLFRLRARGALER